MNRNRIGAVDVRRLAPTLACVVGLILINAGCITSSGDRDLRALGLEYRLQKLNDPRPNRVHILRVDLANKGIRAAVVIADDPDGSGPAEAALTDPLKLASDRSVLAFINANPWDSFPDSAGKKDRSWFEGQPVDILGLAVSGNRERSPALPGGASVWVDGWKRVFLGDVPGDASVVEGMAGFQPIIGKGTVVVPKGGPQHPRTAIGVDRTGSVMWLVVVDGRQPHFSEGMTLEELGGVMRHLGCWDATNLDGGGSSIMGLAGHDGLLRVVNSPSGRILGVIPKLRPVPVILTIRRAPKSNPPGVVNKPSR
jgi:hypothetical protein